MTNLLRPYWLLGSSRRLRISLLPVLAAVPFLAQIRQPEMVFIGLLFMALSTFMLIGELFFHVSREDRRFDRLVLQTRNRR